MQSERMFKLRAYKPTQRESERKREGIGFASKPNSLIKARVSSEIRDSPAFVAKGSKDDSSFIKHKNNNCPERTRSFYSFLGAETVEAAPLVRSGGASLRGGVRSVRARVFSRRGEDIGVGEREDGKKRLRTSRSLRC